MTATDSPGKTSKLTPRSAGTSPWPARESFHKPSVLSIGSKIFCPGKKQRTGRCLYCSRDCRAMTRRRAPYILLLVVRKGLDRILAAGHPGRIACTDYGSRQSGAGREVTP